MKSYEHNGVACLSCGTELETATPVNAGSGDLDGGYSVCVYCGEVSMYVVTDGIVSLRQLSLDELKQFQAEFGEFIRTFNCIQAAHNPFRDDQEKP